MSRRTAVQHRDRALAALEGPGAAGQQLRQLAYFGVKRAL
jgi:hypothetical protein